MGLFDFFKKKKKPAEDQIDPANPPSAPVDDAPTDAVEVEVTPEASSQPKAPKPKSSKKKPAKKVPAKKSPAKESKAEKAKPQPVEVEETAASKEPEPAVEEIKEVAPPEEQFSSPAIQPTIQPEPQPEPLAEPEAESPAEPEPEAQPEAPAEVSASPVEEDPAAPEEPAKPAKKSWFSKLKDGLGKSANKITASLSIFGKPKLDASDLEDIEDALIMADLGVAAATRLAEGLKKRDYPNGVDQDSLSEALADEVTSILTPVAKPLTINPQHKPHVILMVGVNGSGKTTTAGKLAEQWHQAGLKVTMAAADTFRAAAVEQLKIWGERTGTTVIAGEQGSDAAAVAYQAYEQAINEGADVLIVDTAGRLQAKTELMDELAKICRVIGKKDDAAPHDRVIVLDGTVGQNALSQVSAFKETAGLTGMIVTKLDGSARGGVVVALAQEFGLPIHAVGVGEGKNDLDAFDAVDFGRALAGLDAQSRG
jgi:fused signal recognition particle receptor